MVPERKRNPVVRPAQLNQALQKAVTLSQYAANGEDTLRKVWEHDVISIKR